MKKQKFRRRNRHGGRGGPGEEPPVSISKNVKDRPKRAAPSGNNVNQDNFTAKGAAFQVRTDPHENIKAWLHRYGELQHEADRLWDRVDELRVRIAAARSTNLDGMPHGSNTDADRIGADLSRLEELEQEAREAQKEVTAARREIEAAIRKISGRGWADQREVLRLRYIDGLKWEDAAERLFGDDPKFWDRQDVFLRRAFKLHRAALEALAQFVPLQTGQKNNTLEDDRK